MKGFLILVLVFIAACGCDKNSTVKNGDNPDGFKKLSKPLVIDTSFIQRSDTLQKLSYHEIRNFGISFLEHSSTQDLAGNFNECCKIDSLKQNHSYASYMDSLGIGMTKDAIAYKIGYKQFKDSSQMLIWGITICSYEACPVFYGKQIIGSYKNSKGNFTHVLLGELSSWADPPAMYKKVLTTDVSNDGEFFMTSVEISDDADVPGEQTTKSKLKFKIEKKDLKIFGANKSVVNTEKSE